MPKRPRYSRLLVDLPHDVLELIFSFALRCDVIILSTLSREYRAALVPYIFSSVRATWEQVILLQKGSTVGARVAPYASSVRITDADSYNEYQQSTFEQLLGCSVFPRLHAVTVNLASLSYWLRYNACTHVRALTLYSECSANVKIFHMSHVEGLTGLELLTLHHYHFNFTEEEEREPLLGLRSLVLHDCTWEYPFDLASFNRLDLLRTLALSYSHNTSFVLLERFVAFLLDPFAQHLSSLRTLRVEFVDTRHKKLLTLTILERFLDAFDGLELLELSGWTANLYYLKNVLSGRTFLYPLLVKLRLDVMDEAYLRYHEEFLRSTQNVPNLAVRLAPIRGPTSPVSTHLLL